MAAHCPAIMRAALIGMGLAGPLEMSGVGEPSVLKRSLSPIWVPGRVTFLAMVRAGILTMALMGCAGTRSPDDASFDAPEFDFDSDLPDVALPTSDGAGPGPSLDDAGLKR